MIRTDPYVPKFLTPPSQAQVMERYTDLGLQLVCQNVTVHKEMNKYGCPEKDLNWVDKHIGGAKQEVYELKWRTFSITKLDNPNEVYWTDYVVPYESLTGPLTNGEYYQFLQDVKAGARNLIDVEGF